MLTAAGKIYPAGRSKAQLRTPRCGALICKRRLEQGNLRLRCAGRRWPRGEAGGRSEGVGAEPDRPVEREKYVCELKGENPDAWETRPMSCPSLIAASEELRGGLQKHPALSSPPCPTDQSWASGRGLQTDSLQYASAGSVSALVKAGGKQWVSLYECSPS